MRQNDFFFLEYIQTIIQLMRGSYEKQMRSKRSRRTDESKEMSKVT